MKSYIKFLLGFYAEVFSTRMMKVCCGSVLIIFLLSFPTVLALATANLWLLLLYIITIPSIAFAVAKFDVMGL
jgi:hypothetical protein